MRRLKSILAVVLCVMCLPLEVLAGKQPNIVIIMTDNLGYGDIGIYGGLRAPTPRIDQLARSGIQFRDFQVEPACTPSRAAIMTGRMAVRSGTDAVLEPGVPGGLHPAEITLAEMLRAAGYATAHYGKWHLGFAHERQPQMQGFDDFWGILFTSAPGDPADPDIQGKSGGGAYSDALMEIDHNTGRILDAIADENIREDTIVIWLSDNGPQRFTLEPYHFGDPGPWSGELGSVFEGGLRTAGMISWPGTIKPFVSDQLVHSMDLFATLARWAGAKIPEDRPIDSIDQSDYLTQQAKDSKREYVMVFYNGQYAAMRFRQYKVMRAVYARKGSLMSAPQYLNSIPRIYNLRADPKEEYVISGGPEGITRSLVLKEVSLRLAYKKSFEEFPNADYSYMK